MRGVLIDLDVALTKFAALDSDDLLYLKEQMEAEEDAERLRRRTEKRAFVAFKISSLPFSVPSLLKDFMCSIIALAIGILTRE